MALDKASLQSDLSTVFTDMLDVDKATDSYFAKGISEAVVSYVSGGAVSTVDAGTVSAGTYAGSGSGKLTVESGCDEEDSSDWTGCAKKILDACTYMKEHAEDEGFNGSDYLAEKIGEAIQLMADEGEVNTDVKGTVTPPSGSTSTLNGSAKGTITVTTTTLVSKLKETFSTMWDSREEEGFDGNAEFAKTLATQIDMLYKAGVINTDGQEALSGSSGVGSIS